MRLRDESGRRPRLSDSETEARMLAAGARLVSAHGLSLSLEHLPMEDLIREAGVSRTSSYRRWPSKDLFAADLLLDLARAAELSADIPGLREALAAAVDRLSDHLDSPQGRRDAVVEFLRVTLETDFVAMLHSGDWQTYICLRAAHVGLPDGELRARVADALTATERRFTAARAAAFRRLVELLGYRARRPDLRTWEQLSLTLGAVATGMLVRGYSDPEAVTATTELAAYGSTLVAPWSAATLASVGVVLGAVEPDPDVVWDAERIAALMARLTDLDGTIRQIRTALT